MEDLQYISIRAFELRELILDEDVDCLLINERQYESNGCLEKLKMLSQHMHANASYGVRFGVLSNRFGARFFVWVESVCDQKIISSFTMHEKHYLDLLVDEMLVPI